MELKSVLEGASARLAAAGIPSPRMNAELLLRFTLGCDRAYLYAHPERELTQEEQNRYDTALAERSRGVPAQYITGHQEFWGMDLIVTPAVLIPRPETEHVIETVLELIKTDASRRDLSCQRRELTGGSGSAAESLKIRIADVGTGSGCIALALAKELPRAEIEAIDISRGALEIARANAARHQLESRVHFREADLLSGQPEGCFDFVVSNPPYVGSTEADEVQLEVRKFEPQNAVFAGETGIEIIERLIPQAWTALKSGGWLAMEVSGTIAEHAKELLQEWNRVEIMPDLQSIPRVVRAQKG